jgi:hypothetical protein
MEGRKAGRQDRRIEGSARKEGGKCKEGRKERSK